MSRFCILCGLCKAADSSIHLFPVPKDEYKRKEWMDAVGKYLPVAAFICSKHFLDHFIGDKKLLKGAKPSCAVSTECEEVKLEVIIKEEDFKNCPDGDSENFLQSNTPLNGNINSSSTLTPCSSEIIYMQMPSKKRRFSKSRYFGDCHISDMYNPEKAIRNWQIAKKTIENQRKKIALLRCQNLRLRKKIDYLSGS